MNTKVKIKINLIIKLKIKGIGIFFSCYGKYSRPSNLSRTRLLLCNKVFSIKPFQIKFEKLKK